MKRFIRDKCRIQYLKYLGFSKLNQSREVEGTPAVLGMINKVAHLLKVENI